MRCILPSVGGKARAPLRAIGYAPDKDRDGAAETALISASFITKMVAGRRAVRSQKFTFIDPVISEFDMLIAGPRPVVAAAFISMR
jgi:hypothetical protein